MKNILCFGDSNAWGFIPGKASRYDSATRWTGIAAKALGEDYRLLEECVSGRTTVYEDPCANCRCGIDSIGCTLLSQAPLDLIVLALGTNDLKFTDSGGSMRGAAKLIDTVKNCDALFDSYAPIFPEGVRILLLGPIAIDPLISMKRPDHALAGAADESSLLSDKYARLAHDKGVYFLDASAYAAPSPVDCLHMEAEDHARLGLAVAEKIREIFSAG